MPCLTSLTPLHDTNIEGAGTSMKHYAYCMPFIGCDKGATLINCDTTCHSRRPRYVWQGLTVAIIIYYYS